MEDCVMIADGAMGGGVREFVRACVCVKEGDKEPKEWCVYRGIREQRGIVGLSQEKEISSVWMRVLALSRPCRCISVLLFACQTFGASRLCAEDTDTDQVVLEIKMHEVHGAGGWAAGN